MEPEEKLLRRFDEIREAQEAFEKTQGILMLLDADGWYRPYLIHAIHYLWDPASKVDLGFASKLEDISLAFDPAKLTSNEKYKLNLENFRVIIDEKELDWYATDSVNLVAMGLLRYYRLQPIIRNLKDEDYIGQLPHDQYPINVYACSNWTHTNVTGLQFLKKTKLCLKFFLYNIHPELLEVDQLQILISLIPDTKLPAVK